jgi:hypothetical protein
MSRKLRLPDLDDYEIVAFHYNPEKDKNRVTLQIPVSGFAGSNTFHLYFDNAKDVEYIMQRRNGYRLYDYIRTYGHVAYRRGEIRILEEKKDATRRFHDLRADAARRYSRTPEWQTSCYRKISALWRRKQK